ncbi:MAG: radical SAM protein [Bacteroidales bacterium]|nr:radical SAM protein [Bacteroidales bacterium]
MKVNEIFYLLQGEGHYTGTPAVFVRFAGCNLRCWFCDTDFEKGVEMSEDEIVEAVLQYPTRYVVITGGEPTLQITASLCDKLHAHGLYLMMETNGTRPLPEGCKVDWITCSPKLIDVDEGKRKIATIRLRHIDELKVVFEDSPTQDMALYEQIPATEYRLQPCDTQDPLCNQAILNKTIKYILQHPKWKLSLQTHKILHVR